MSNPQNRTSGTNWDQYHQSTPKLLPPTVFERTTSATNLNEDVTATNSLNITIHPNADGSSSSLDYRSLDSANEKQLLLKLSGEVEKLRFEVKKFKSENEALRHKNKGSNTSNTLIFSISIWSFLTKFLLTYITNFYAEKINNKKVKMP